MISLNPLSIKGWSFNSLIPHSAKAFLNKDSRLLRQISGKGRKTPRRNILGVFDEICRNKEKLEEQRHNLPDPETFIQKRFVFMKRWKLDGEVFWTLLVWSDKISPSLHGLDQMGQTINLNLVYLRQKPT